MFKLFILCIIFFKLVFSQEDLNTIIVSVNGFKKLADFVLTDKNSFDPDLLFDGAVLFVKTDYLGFFFKKKFPRIRNRFILISHDGDYPAPRKHKKYLKHEKLIAWLGLNPTVINEEKFYPLPIGIKNRNSEQEDLQYIKNMQKNELEKKHLAYLNISLGTYPYEREKVHQMFHRMPYCYNASKKPYKGYLKDIKTSKFVFSPRGNGLDCYRTWEAILMGSIPIVKSSYLNPLLEDLPVLIIDNWEEVTEDFLLYKWEEIQNTNYSLDKLYLSYWQKLIDKILDKEGIVR